MSANLGPNGRNRDLEQMPGPSVIERIGSTKRERTFGQELWAQRPPSLGVTNRVTQGKLTATLLCSSTKARIF